MEEILNRILSSTSYAALDSEAQEFLCRYLQDYYAQQTPTRMPVLVISTQRDTLSLILLNLSSQLSEIEQFLPIKAVLPRAFIKQKQEVLLFAFFMFSAQYQFEVAHGLAAEQRAAQIQTVARLYQAIADQPSSDCQQALQVQIAQAVDDSDKPVKYLGLTILAPAILSSMQTFFYAKQKDLLWLQQEFNKKRRYWSWASGLLSNIFNTLSTDFHRTQSARQAFADNAVISSYVSWIQLYTHFGIELGSVAYHSMVGATAEERAITHSERFIFEIKQRKFRLMQDGFSIGIGLMIAWWAVSNSPFALWAQPLAVSMRVLSLMLSCWEFAEQNELFKKQQFLLESNAARLDNKRAILCEQQVLLSDCLHVLLQQQNRAIARDDLDADEQQQRVLCQKQIAELSDALESAKIVISSLDSHSEALRKDQHQHARLWIQKKYQHMLNIALSLGLITGSITVMCAYFPPLAVLPMMHLLGLSICFSAIVLHTAVEGELNTHHAVQSNRNIRAESELLLDKFNHTDYVPEKKLLYLEMQRLHAQSDYQQAMISYQQMRVLHTLCLQVMCPALIFASFLVMPAASFVLLSLIFLLSVLSTQYLARYEPKITVDLRFRDDLFEKFVAQPSFGTLKKQLDMQRNQPVSAVMPAASDTNQTDKLTDEPSDEAHDSEAGMV